MLGLKICSLFEMEYTSSCAPVDLIFNGEFRGNYNPYDQIEYGKDRINFDKFGNFLNPCDRASYPGNDIL